jgi:hypothetical protein
MTTAGAKGGLSQLLDQGMAKGLSERAALHLAERAIKASELCEVFEKAAVGKDPIFIWAATCWMGLQAMKELEAMDPRTAADLKASYIVQLMTREKG